MLFASRSKLLLAKAFGRQYELCLPPASLCCLLLNLCGTLRSKSSGTPARRPCMSFPPAKIWRNNSKRSSLWRNAFASKAPNFPPRTETYDEHRSTFRTAGKTGSTGGARSGPGRRQRWPRLLHLQFSGRGRCRAGLLAQAAAAHSCVVFGGRVSLCGNICLPRPARSRMGPQSRQPDSREDGSRTRVRARYSLSERPNALLPAAKRSEERRVGKEG